MSIWDDLDNEEYMESNKKLKRVSIAMNCVLWMLGVLLIALGAYSLNALKGVSELLDISLPSGVIVIGVFFVVLTIVGCYASYRERLGGLAIYTMLMLLLLVCLVGIGAGTFSYRSEVMGKLGDAWYHASDGTKNVTQRVFKCCGWTNTTDKPVYGAFCYNTTEYYYTPLVYADQLPYNKSCNSAITSKVQDYLYVAATAAVVIGVIEFVAVLVSLFLVVRVCRNPRRDSARLLGSDGL